MSASSPPIASPKVKLSLLLQTLKSEADTFMHVLEGQVRSLAYVHSILGKSCVLACEDNGQDHADQFFGCMDVSRDMVHTCTFTGAQDKNKLQFDDISNPSMKQTNQQSQGDIVPIQGRVYVTIRFDYWDRLWMMGYDGKIYQIEDPFPKDTKLQHAGKEYLMPEISDQPMVRFAGKMMRTDIDKYFMACKLSNSTIEIFQTCEPEDNLITVGNLLRAGEARLRRTVGKTDDLTEEIPTDLSGE
jgi:hypothetical protein